MELSLQLARDLDALEDAAVGYVKNRRATIALLHRLADSLPKIREKANIVKMVGSSTGIVASGLVIGGFVGSFFTFGTSLFISSVGASLGAAAGLTTAGGVAIELLDPKFTKSTAKRMLEHDQTTCEGFRDALQRVNSTWRDLRAAGRINTGATSGGSSVVESMYDLVQVSSLAFQEGEVADQRSFKAWSEVGRSMVSASLLINLIAIPLDLHTMISSAISIRRQTVPEASTVIRDIADQLDCPSEEEMLGHVSRIREELRVPNINAE